VSNVVRTRIGANPPDSSFPRKWESRGGEAGDRPCSAPPPPLDSRFRGNDESGGSVNDESGGSVNDESGGSVNDESGGSVNDESGGSVNDESGRLVNDESGRLVLLSDGVLFDTA